MRIVMILFAVAALGALLAPVAYLVLGAGFLLLAVRLLTHGTKARRDDRRAVRAAMAVRSEWAPPRDSAWGEAEEKRRRERRALAEQVEKMGERYRALAGRPGATAGYHQLYAEMRDEARKTFGQAPKRLSHSARRGAREWNVPMDAPRDEVLHLDRAFAAITDCRYGHVEAHILGDRFAAPQEWRHAERVVRECGSCEPATHWTEWI